MWWIRRGGGLSKTAISINRKWIFACAQLAEGSSYWRFKFLLDKFSSSAIVRGFGKSTMMPSKESSPRLASKRKSPRTSKSPEESEKERTNVKKAKSSTQTTLFGGVAKAAKKSGVEAKKIALEKKCTGNLKIASWNVNGARAVVKNGYYGYFNTEDADIMCIQETKCQNEDIPEEFKLDGYHCYWSSAEKKGYSGTGIMSKIKPVSVKYGIGISKHDTEGRSITAEYEKFFLVNTYVPNAGQGLKRLDYRIKEWNVDFQKYLTELEKKKPVILTGDLNVAHNEIDIEKPSQNKKSAGFTIEERNGFSELLDTGFVDSFRHLYPESKREYTFWSYRQNARANNIGWRLDYFVLSPSLIGNLKDCIIRKEVMGSDHCPIILCLEL
eukprot:Nk52_evm76s215 gene=Nk52_evmTU76s215